MILSDWDRRRLGLSPPLTPAGAAALATRRNAATSAVLSKTEAGPVSRAQRDSANFPARTSVFPMCHTRGGNPNIWDACLAEEGHLWQTIECCGGITGLCKRADTVRYEENDPPWIKMPTQGRRFQEINSVPLAVFVLNTDLAVLTFQVPVGYDGVISGNTNRFIGPGFVEGSGDIEWRIQLSRRYAPDYGLVLTSLGDLTAPVPFSGGGIRIYSHQTIRYIARITNFALLDPNGRVMCALYGWFFPRP